MLFDLNRVMDIHSRVVALSQPPPTGRIDARFENMYMYFVAMTPYSYIKCTCGVCFCLIAMEWLSLLNREELELIFNYLHRTDRVAASLASRLFSELRADRGGGCVRCAELHQCLQWPAGLCLVECGGSFVHCSST